MLRSGRQRLVDHYEQMLAKHREAETHIINAHYQLQRYEARMDDVIRNLREECEDSKSVAHMEEAAADFIIYLQDVIQKGVSDETDEG